MIVTKFLAVVEFELNRLPHDDNQYPQSGANTCLEKLRFVPFMQAIASNALIDSSPSFLVGHYFEIAFAASTAAEARA